MKDFNEAVTNALFLATRTDELSVERCIEVANQIAPQLMTAARKILSEEVKQCTK